MKLRYLSVLAAAVLAFPALAAAPAPGIPPRPEQLVFPPFKFEVPKADPFKFKLANGATAYVSEDHSLPLVNISITFKVGAFLEPVEKVGLAGFTGALMRKGGAGARTAEDFDERADFLAAAVYAGIGDTSASVSLNALTFSLNPSLDLLFDMLTAPRFQQDRLDIEKGSTIEGLKQRNDSPQSIAGREWQWLLNGSKHFSSRPLTKTNVEKISREDLITFHKRFLRPENIVTLAISGDVNTKEILAELNRRFAAWKPDGKAEPIAWPPPAPDFQIKPGVYHVEKDINQGNVMIGHLTTTWKNPDHYALVLMNHILGSGGFTSRITKKIRSDEGLAYSAGSSFGLGTWWPGVFRAGFQTKSATVAFGAKLALAEIRRIQEQPVTDDELQVAKNAMIESFPRAWESKAAIVGTFAADDLVGRSHSYWEEYQKNLAKVTVADIQRVAKQYLKPDQVVFLVVGKWSEIEPGDPEKRANMKEFFGGQVTHLPVRDPLSLEPLP